MNISRIFRRLPLNVFTYDSFMPMNSQIQIQNKVMRYSRWSHRRPSKIVFPNNEIEDITEESYVEKANKNTKDINHDRSNIKSFSKPTHKTKPHTSQITKEDSISDSDEESNLRSDENKQLDGTTFTTLFNTDSTLR